MADPRRTGERGVVVLVVGEVQLEHGQRGVPLFPEYSTSFFLTPCLQGDSGGLGLGLGCLRFKEFPRLVGRFSSYLLPNQHSGASQIQVNPRGHT